jgi:MoaA/NifB/PqqE/SkfB family radical SAM enzyme
MRDDWKEKKKEWNDRVKYNSFNSYKGLAWYQSHYKPIAAWFMREGELPAPIELSLDPAHVCNFTCPHCNAQRYLILKPEEVPEDKRIMTKNHLRNLIDFCADWGVKGVCIGGGGEPLMNKAVWDLPSYITSKGMQVSYATNGSLINEQIADEMMNCRWVGVSVDSSTPKTFKKIHGIDAFEKVVSNLRMLTKRKAETGSKIDISYKFLISPANWNEVYDACKLAKDIGVQDFHARPADLERKDFESAMKLNYDIDAIQELFAKAHELEDEKFRVFTVMHKYDPNFKVMHTFKKCSSSNLMLQACANGKVYVCADHRIEPRFELGSHFPDPKDILNFWGSDKHRKLLESICVDKECGRCTYGEYARQIEELAMGTNGDDPMCLAFP